MGQEDLLKMGLQELDSFINGEFDELDTGFGDFGAEDGVPLSENSLDEMTTEDYFVDLNVLDSTKEEVENEGDDLDLDIELDIDDINPFTEKKTKQETISSVELENLFDDIIEETDAVEVEKESKTSKSKSKAKERTATAFTPKEEKAERTATAFTPKEEKVERKATTFTPKEEKAERTATAFTPKDEKDVVVEKPKRKTTKKKETTTKKEEPVVKEVSNIIEEQPVIVEQLLTEEDVADIRACIRHIVYKEVRNAFKDAIHNIATDLSGK